MNRNLTKANIFTFTAYFLTALFALKIDPIAGFGSLIWPPAGIAIAGFFIYGRRVWPGIFAGSLLVNLWMDVSILASLLVAIGNAFGPLLAVHWLRRRKFKPDFSDPRQIPLFFLAVLFSSFVVAVVGISSVEAFADNRVGDFVFSLTAWWLGNVMGDLVVAPLILAFIYRKPRQPKLRHSLREALALILSTTAVTLAVFFDWIPAVQSEPKPYLLFPFVAWAAVRFQQIGATFVIFLSVTIALIGTYFGFGPFAETRLNTSLVQLPAFILSISLMGLLLAAYVSTLNRTQAYLHRLNRRLDYQIHVRNRELLQTNRRFKRNKQMLEQAQHMARLGCWEWLPEKSVVHWSKELYSIFDVQQSEFKATYDAYLKLLPAHERSRVDRIIRDALTQKKSSFEFEHSYFRDSGEMLILHCHGSIQRNELGQAVEIIGTAQDITREKKILEELRTATTAAETANREKSNFLANMSHEIRTPLSVILGSSELLEEADIEPQDRTRLVRSIQKNGNLLLALITDILDLAKIEAGKVQVELGNLSLGDFFEQIHSLLQQRIHERGLHFEIRVETPIPDRILTDSIRLQQIFVNVIGNALRFTARGKIEILARMLPEGNRPYLAFDIRDTGVGMTKEQIGRIFNPFVQAEDSIKRQFGGTGLGLTLSRRLARALGGDLVVLSSRPGHGTTFRLTIDPGPVASRKWVSEFNLPEALQTWDQRNKPNPHTRAESKTSHQTSLVGLKLLLVDDSVENRQLITRFLKGAGASVHSATNGEQAIQMVVKNNYDVVLMDIQMPVLNGEEATQKLRKMGYQLPIIALTAHALASDRKRFLEKGFSDYMSKPFTRAHLIEHVAQATPAH